MVWQLRCMRLYLPEEIKLPESGRDVQKLEIKDAEYIYNQSEYSDLTDIDYIRDRISRGISFGIRKEEKLLGWVMTHDDGAVGFLHVDEAYRKQGIAKKLMSAICQKLRKEGKIPFLHIEESNDKSMGLARKLGFVEDRAVSWFEKRFTRES